MAREFRGLEVRNFARDLKGNWRSKSKIYLKGNFLFVQVDDVQGSECTGSLLKLRTALARKSEMATAGPFLTAQEYEQGHSASTIRFLKGNTHTQGNVCR